MKSIFVFAPSPPPPPTSKTPSPCITLMNFLVVPLQVKKRTLFLAIEILLGLIDRFKTQ